MNKEIQEIGRDAIFSHHWRMQQILMDFIPKLRRAVLIELDLIDRTDLTLADMPRYPGVNAPMKKSVG